MIPVSLTGRFDLKWNTPTPQRCMSRAENLPGCGTRNHDCTAAGGTLAANLQSESIQIRNCTCSARATSSAWCSEAIFLNQRATCLLNHWATHGCLCSLE